MSLLRLATVPYCNAFPLTHYLSDFMDCELKPVLPSEMKPLLQAGEISAALMPVAELLDFPDAEMISDCCIASDGAVQSVKIISKKPLDKIETLALDTASKSSNTVADVILRHFYRNSPQKTSLPQHTRFGECPADAFVVIGDRCLKYFRETPVPPWDYQFDLGALWKQHTGLPLVFAAWITLKERHQLHRDALILSLCRARDKGIQHFRSIVREKQRAGIKFPVSDEAVMDYYRHAIKYCCGDTERQGLQKFFELAHSMNVNVLGMKHR